MSKPTQEAVKDFNLLVKQRRHDVGNYAATAMRAAKDAGQLLLARQLPFQGQALYEGSGAMARYCKDEEVGGVIFVDKSARPLWVGVSEYWRRAYAHYHSLRAREVIMIFTLTLTSLLAFGSSQKVISITALCIYLFTENYFRVYMSTVLNRFISSNRAALLSLGSVIRNGVGALMIAGAGVFSNVSIVAALIFIVLLKIPAISYVLLRTHKRAFSQ